MVAYPWILPVNIDTIKFVLVNKIGNVLGQLMAVLRLHAFSEDIIGFWRCREVPSTKCQDSLDTHQLLELLKFMFGQDIADLRFIVT